MRDDVISGFDRVLWLISGTVAILLIVAASNVASLVLVRVESRQPELAVRSALGAPALSIRLALAAETTMLCVAGGTLGLGFAAIALTAVVRAAPGNVPRLNEVTVDTGVVLAAVVVTGLFALLGAGIGALRVPMANAMAVLRDGGRTGTAGRAARRLRTAFVVVEVALSLVLLAASGVLGRSVLRLRVVQPGFDPSNTFTFWTFLPNTSYKRSTDAARFYRDAIDRLQRLPGVESVAVTAKLPLEIEGFPYKILIWPDDGSDASRVLPPTVQSTSVSNGYFRTIGIPVIAGRTFDDANVRRGLKEAVASRGFVARTWHDETGRTGVGKRLRPAADGPWFTIVGVVGDVRDSTLTLPAISQVYFPEEASEDSATVAPNTTGRDMAFVVRTRAPSRGWASILRSELHAIDPALPFYRPASMDQVVADARGRVTFALALLTIGAAATLFLGVVGLFSVIAYVVTLRSREISIRIALGLPPAEAARMILWEGEAIAAAGATAGVAVFLLFAKLLRTLAFEVSPADPATLGAASVTVLIVATLATWIPARRAARIDPAETLKTE
jgi:predicted permease